ADVKSLGKIVVQQSVVASLLQIKVCLRRSGYLRAYAKEVVFGSPQIVEPDVGVSFLAEDSWEEGFAFKAAIKLCRGQCRGSKLNKAELVGGRQLNPESE